MDENNDVTQSIFTLPVDTERVREWMQILHSYHAGLARTKQRLIGAENWWKLRNTLEEGKQTEIGRDGGFVSTSGWLHNVIVSKHADAMDSYPEPRILPRERADQAEARMLTAIIPCILEQNQFEKTYSDVMWQKMKYGTGVYKVVWDPEKLNGLGDIRVERVNLLNLFWEPGVTDIQNSRFLFHTELVDRAALREEYPELSEMPKSSFVGAKFLYDDSVSAQDKETVVEVYYHKRVEGRMTLQYARFVGDQVLFATENDLELYRRGLYDHGRYPYEFDPLFPIEGSPCGYGYVDICRSPQTEIDLLKTSFVKNAMVGSAPRYFARTDGKVNEEEFLDLSNPIVHVAGTLDETALRQIGHVSLDGNYVRMLEDTVAELRETSGNTETSTGNISAGVTAASAIAALQEASGKGSRDASQSAYRCFGRVVELCVELVRQFYDMPRAFRIMGEQGVEEFVSYDNRRLGPQHQGFYLGQDMGYRLPVFDIRISAQKKSAYSRLSQNELAKEFFRLGFFNPQLADQALQALEMMDFEGKEQVCGRIASNLARQREQAVRNQLAAQAAAAQEIPARGQSLIDPEEQIVAMARDSAHPTEQR